MTPETALPATEVALARMDPDADASLRHLLGRLAVVEHLVRDAIEARRAVDANPDDAFRGLYLSDDDIDRLLAPPIPGPISFPTQLCDSVETHATADEAAGADLRIRHLATNFGLDAIDVDLLLVAVAPDIDRRFEPLYGYLNDDVTQRRASVGVALELTGLATTSAAARSRFVDGPLAVHGLVAMSDLDRPFLTRPLSAPDRVVAHLLGDDALDHAVKPFVVGDARGSGDPTSLVRALGSAANLVDLHEQRVASGMQLAVAALAEVGRSALVVDLTRLGGDEHAAIVAKLSAREARLRGGVIVAGPIDVVVADHDDLRAFTELEMPIVLFGSARWDPRWSDVVPLMIDVPAASLDARRATWQHNLGSAWTGGFDPADDTVHFQLTPEQIARAARMAIQQAELHEEPISISHLRSGARAQNGIALERTSRRIEPAVHWPELVLPPACMGALRELTDRVRHRDRVIGSWGMRPGGGRGRGITALFAGDSGTGKTMSAEVIAGALGLDLYTVNLATVVDKYVGETEKNLEKIFVEADGINGVLLFDEADALFGKRSEVRDAHDRYANIEVAYLLQRMESFEGLAILATNLRANLDPAFTRRLDAVVDFAPPDEEQRRLLWDRCLGTRIVRDADVDLDFCARQFELTGGNIRSITITAAYFAAAASRPVGMLDLVRATEREYRKLGRLCVRAEFGHYLDQLTA